jgi:hypothetical protein
MGKDAYVEFDGVTSKLIQQNDNFPSLAIGVVTSKLKGALKTAKSFTKPILSVLRLKTNSH